VRTENRPAGVMNPFRLMFALFLGLATLVFPKADVWAGETEIEIHAEQINTFAKGGSSPDFSGALEFRGGLVLTSSNKSFGGISSLILHGDGDCFLAASDWGFWFRGRILYENNRPAAIADAVMAPILDTDGKSSLRIDSESMATDGQWLYVGIERTHRILRFEYGKELFRTPGENVPVPPEIRNLPKNQSLEALVLVPKRFPLGGTLLALSESGLDSAGNIKAFLIGGPTPGKFVIKRRDAYDISDAALLPQGDILILERKYELNCGIMVRIRQIPLSEIKPDALVDGQIIFEADARYNIDNMEALSIHRSHSGDTILTMMSDDNLLPTQSTLLLQFALKDKSPMIGVRP
jgi:hypothetical protein